ncbi:hypothetical protein SAMN04488498_12644 [Mesorhizobium albiziae]|uniref:Uncharacterized protein n=1 Tax=Neomesorhizobium albiziae TaxID=335020 RepID=A0A1I4EGG1_9HYPH|nr:hypothetical protein SAMN04488498_12644 [Mesorhizobium albiziae]
MAKAPLASVSDPAEAPQLMHTSIVGGLVVTEQTAVAVMPFRVGKAILSAASSPGRPSQEAAARRCRIVMVFLLRCRCGSPVWNV